MLPSIEVTDSLDDHWRTHWRETFQEHPELTALMEAWPMLLEPVKAGILAMVRASPPGR